MLNKSPSTASADDGVFLVADQGIRRANVWTRLQRVNVRAFGRREFSIVEQLPADVSILLYQVGARFSDIVHMLERIFERQRDLCVILIGNDIGTDRAARVLRAGAFDYLTWPCPASRLSEAIENSRAARRTRLNARNVSDELARVNQALTRDRDGLARCTRSLSFLQQLTQVVAGTVEPEAIVKGLFTELPPLIDADLIGLACADPDHVWMWSKPQDHGRTDAVRSRLLDRLGRAVGRRMSSREPLRLVPNRHLSLVPASASRNRSQDDRAVSVHEVRLVVGPSGAGILHVERAPDRPFTEQEQQLLDAVAALLALALGHAGAHRQIQESALRDPLTSLFNRRALEGLLHRELTAGFRYGAPACVLLLDLDYFKTVNERLGHIAGDGVLTGVAALVEEAVRDVDSVSRYGGDEFAVVLPHTDLRQAHALAERIRAEVERRAFEVEEGHVRITASIGLTSLQDSAIESVGEWIAAADSAMYEAKSRGRNCVVTHAASPLAPTRVALSHVA